MKKISYILFVPLLLVIAAASPLKKSKNPMKDTEKHKALVRSLYEDCLNKRNMALLPSLFADTCEIAPGRKGAKGFEQTLAPLISAFPDIQWHIEDLFAEGDKVCVSWQWTGTHTGSFQNFAAGGNNISNRGMAIYTVKNGRISQAGLQTDRLGFLQAMRILPGNINLIEKPAPADAVRFIDRFIMPAASEKAFTERMTVDRNFIRTMPGFIKDEVYKSSDGKGNTLIITLAVWDSEESVKKAKEAVGESYKKEGFVPEAFYNTYGIVMERNIYKMLTD